MPFLQEYTMLDELGKGGFATVYKVRHNELGYIRAIRVLNETVVDANSATYQKFLRECKLLLRLGNGNHPNIVHIYQPRLLDNKALVEMDYVDGQDIMHYLKQNQNFVPVEEVVRMATQMSSALAYCHEDIYRFCMDRDEDNLQDDSNDGSKVLLDDETRQRLINKYKVIHNDIHSGNIIRREDGNFVLLDFGLAINGEEVVRSSRHTNGAPEYKAPEKWEDDSILTEQSDIYSFGIVMYQYLAGRVPFLYNDQISNHKAQFELGEAHQKTALPAIKTLRKEFFEKKFKGQEYKKDYPQWIEDAILKCLQKNPANRFRNGKELYDFITKHAVENAKVSDDTGQKWENTTRELYEQIDALRSVKESLRQQVEQLAQYTTKIKEDQQSAKLTGKRMGVDTNHKSIKYPIDSELLDIIETASHNNSVFAAFNARKICYRLCKEKINRPDYREYVQRLQLQHFPVEYQKSKIAQHFMWRWIPLSVLCLESLVVCLLSIIIMFVDGTGYDEEFIVAIALPIFIFSLWLLRREFKKVKKKVEEQSQPSADTSINNQSGDRKTVRLALAVFCVVEIAIILMFTLLIPTIQDDQSFKKCQTVDDFVDYLRDYGSNANHYDEARNFVDSVHVADSIAKKEKEWQFNGISFHTGNVNFKMLFVKGGTFQMGSSSGDDSEQPVHSVTVSDFYMGEFEVTQDLWQEVMGTNVFQQQYRSKRESMYGVGANYPMYYVNYSEAEEFCRLLNERLRSQLPEGYRFALPTEAEWEYAARGGNKSNAYTYSGSNNLSDVAWYTDNSKGSTHAVGMKRANELGLYDMSGNVCELCADWYVSYSSSLQTDPKGLYSSSGCVLRGGGWCAKASHCQVTDRHNVSPGVRNDNFGFRLALVRR